MQAVPPSWVPCRKFIGYWGTVVIGRWVGGLLGYKPYFREYTTDWDYACAKMKSSWFRKRLVHESYNKGVPWEDQHGLVKGSPCNGPMNPEFSDLCRKQIKEVNGHTNGHTNGYTNGHTNGHTNGALI